MQKIQNKTTLLFRWMFLLFMAIAIISVGCNKFLSIPLPSNKIAGNAAYANDASAAATLNSIYAAIMPILSGGSSIGYYSGLYTDELTDVAVSNTTLQALYTNTVTGSITGTLWTSIYQQIYPINRAIEGIQTNADNLVYKNQWLGEAYFLRGLLYYYLTNLYGDVPLATTSLYTTNNIGSRTPAADVYKQIVSDLKQAQTLLTNNYIAFNGQTTTDRARPDKAAATALLARIYLYMDNYTDAQVQADSVISNPDYQLESLNGVFVNTSKEIIWGLDPSYISLYFNVVPDATAYIVIADTTPKASLVNAVLSTDLLNAFEPGDQRKLDWIGVSHTSTADYYYANKYKIRINASGISTEYIVPLRLAEQYLIRAEARAHNNNLSGAAADLDMIRARAGLPATTASSQIDILKAILHERQVELFTECGQRFFNLRRTGNLDKVMGLVSPKKGSNWQSFMQWWPIPTTDITENPNLKQTPGYQE